MTINEYALGTGVICSAGFRSAAGALADPDVVKFSFITPAGVTTTYTYPTDTALKKDATGEYHVAIDANAVGKWHYRFFATGTGQAAAEGSFAIAPSAF